MSIAAIEFFVLYVHSHPADRTSHPLLFAVLVIVGLCTSVTFSSAASVIALLPDRFHYFFFMGTYCPFIVYLPLNVATGNLCYQISAGEHADDPTTSPITAKVRQ